MIKKLFISAFSSSLLLIGAWFIHPFFAFLGFIPLMFIQKLVENSSIKRKNATLFFFNYLAFLVWNVGTTWWIVNSTWTGAILAFTINSLLMCIPVLVASFVAKKLTPISNFFAFPYMLIFFWTAFEYLHLDWDLSWSWLNLGNAFANAHYLIQWYEFTGTFGGTIWILTVNALLFNLIGLKSKDFSYLIKQPLFISLLVVFILPCGLSIYIYKTYKEAGQSNEVIVVQPNIDPYNEKFPGAQKFIPYDEQLKRLLKLTEDKLTRNTRFVAWPETSLPAGYDEDLISDQPHIRNIRFFLTNHPGITLITGSDTYKIYRSEYDKSTTARYGEGVGWYDYFNTALKIDRNYKVGIYHKSKLVPGVEQMPYPQLFKWIENFAIDLGGITGSLGKQEERTVFFNEKNVGVAPVVCYESVYGAFVAEYIKNGANYIFIITNDGWWGNTPGHKQHLAYAKLRAIETRRSIARAANTGISGFINQKGNIILQNNYWEQDALRAGLMANDKLTFYVKFGDYLGAFALNGCYLLLFIAFIFLIFGKKQSQE